MDSPNGHTSHEFSKYLILPGNQDNAQFPKIHRSHERLCFRFACIFITSSETNFIVAALRTNKGTSHGDVSTKTPESGYTLCPVNYRLLPPPPPPPPLNTPGRASYSVLSYALPGPDFLENSPPCRLPAPQRDLSGIGISWLLCHVSRRWRSHWISYKPKYAYGNDKNTKIL